MNPHYPKVSSRANRRCEYCRAPEILHNFPFEVDHIIPLSRGGKSTLENLALSCRSCNLFKSDSTTYTNPSTLVVVNLFHPRMNQWNMHFQFDWDTGKIIGLTEIGISTIERLRMNEPIPLTTRLIWAELKLFP